MKRLCTLKLTVSADLFSGLGATDRSALSDLGGRYHGLWKTRVYEFNFTNRRKLLEGLTKFIKAGFSESASRAEVDVDTDPEDDYHQAWIVASGV